MPRDHDTFPEGLATRFEHVCRLGAGAMGVVHRCRDRELGREVAIKLLLDRADPERRRRFLREAAAMASVDHPHVLKIYDHGLVDEEYPYLVMEYLEGRSLEELEDLEDPLAALLPVAEALEVCHAAGMIHRDVKPANIFRTEDGRTVLLDFGLAKDQDRTAMTRTGHVLGTPVYLAPEALRGEDPAPPWDWYALGVTLFALAERRLPYETKDLVDWMGDPDLRPAFRFERVPADSPVARAVRALMAEDPEARPRSRATLEVVLREPSEARVAPATLPSESQEAPRPPPRSPSATKLPRAAAAAWLLLLVGLGWWLAPTGPVDAPAAPGAPTEPEEPPLLVALGENATGHREFRNTRTGGVMILVPAGPFVSRASPDHHHPGPALQVQVGAFLIGKTEVTVEQFWRYGSLPGRRPRKGLTPGGDRRYANRPMIELTWAEARDFCEWAGGRLPTALEWERAASGPAGWDRPWGAAPPDETLANFGRGDWEAVFQPERFIEDVGSYPGGASPIGALDMAGNVYEWTSTIHEPTRDAPVPDRIVKGGNYYVDADHVVMWHRRGWKANDEPEALGFRLCMDVPPDLPPDPRAAS